MCDEREQLIEYVYGEVEPAARQRIEAHVEDCEACRAEVRGLRGVRDDLLAWDVPRHEPIWRPFVPAVAEAVRRPWPAWALTAAAAAVFAAGLAGGMAARTWGPAAGDGEGQLAHATAGSDTSLQPQAAAVTARDLAELEATILERVRGEISEQVRTLASQTSGGGASVTRVSSAPRSEETEARLAAIEQWMDDQTSLNAAFYGQFSRLNSRTSGLSEQLVEVSRLQTVGLETGGR